MLSSSLPPGIVGEAIGYLTICLRNCSVSESCSHVSFLFWGTAAAIHISLAQSVEIPLIGNQSSIDKYLQDASPLTIQVMGGVRQIGLSSVCLPSLSDLIITCQFPLDVFKSETDQASIGSLALEMSFHMTTVQNPSLGHGSFRREKGNNQSSLLNELLELCSDDMTAPSVPTLGDSFNTSNCPDPFNSWISRMEKQAASPQPPSHELTIQADAISISQKVLVACTSRYEELSENTSIADGSCEPHPVSVFLSNFAKSAQATKHEKEQTNEKNPIKRLERITQDQSMKLKESQHENYPNSRPTAILQPIRSPPLWACIVVSNIHLSSTDKFNNLHLRLTCSNAESTTHDNTEKALINQCSWQFSLRDRDTENIDAKIVLMGDGSLHAMAHTQFNVNANRPKSTINANRIPNIIESGCFDIVDLGESRLGKINVEFCIGTLRQIRFFPQLCKLVISIQRWLRKVVSAKTKDDQDIVIENKECSFETCASTVLGLNNEINSSSFTTNICDQNSTSRVGHGRISRQPRHSLETRSLVRDVDEDIIGSSICMQEQKSIETSSSPDSLFEEWSRHSSRKMHPKTDHEGVDCGGVTLDADSEKCTRATDGKEIEDTLSRAQEAKQVLSELRDTVSSSTNYCAPEDPPDDVSAKGEQLSLVGLPATCLNLDQMKATVIVSHAGGIRQLVNQWCQLQQTNVLSVSGLFISIGSFEKGYGASEEDELNAIFHGDIIHSRLLSIPERMESLQGFEANINIPIESNLTKIQTQTLIFKLWFVPVMTQAVVEAFSNKEAQAAKAHSSTACLEGSKVVATASVPLYSLYTSDLSFDGKVSWVLSGLDTACGFIAATVHRIQVKPNSSPCNNFGCSPEVTLRQSVDPPSSIHSWSNLSVNDRMKNDLNKRKVASQGLFLRRGFKRSRLLQNDLVTSETGSKSHLGSDSSSPRSMNAEIGRHQFNEHTSNLEEQNRVSKSCEASTNASCASPCQDMSSTENAFDKTPISTQEKTKPVLQRAETCEKGSSPLLVALRYADAAVCTSPCEESTSPARECPRESIAGTSVSCYATAPEKGERKMTADMHKNNAEHNNSCVLNNTCQSSDRSSVKQYLGQMDGVDIRVRPHRLRSQARHNYSASSLSPSLNQDTSLLNRNFRSPVSSRLDRSDKRSSLTNRERIERIFSGKK